MKKPHEGTQGGGRNTTTGKVMFVFRWFRVGSQELVMLAAILTRRALL
jgi:hypothetical protein